MIISSALILLLTTHGVSESQAEYNKLSKQLADRIEWMDQGGSSMLTKRAAQIKLDQLSKSTIQEITRKHYSSWKNGKCYWIFTLTTQDSEYRVFFFSRRDAKGQSHVTKIKVT